MNIFMERGEKMKSIIGRFLCKAIIFGVVMTIIGFFIGRTVFTFPAEWLDLIKHFLMYSLAFLTVNILTEWIFYKIKKDKK